MLNSNLEELYESLSESGYNIFNKSDSFYQDNCATYTTINGTDIILSDRKKDIYTESQNQSICQVGCELKSYNQTTRKAKCDCSVTDESTELTDLNIENLFSKKQIEESFYNTLSNSNFQVLKCYKLLFSSPFVKNIGEIFMTILFAILLVLTIIFWFMGPKKISNYINIVLKFDFTKKINNKKKIRKKMTS